MSHRRWCTEEVDRTISDLSETWRLSRRARRRTERYLTPELDLRAKRTAHRLVRVLEAAADSRALQELYVILDTDTEDEAGERRSLFVAWFELLEAFVQEAERRFGDGAGPRKLRFVEAAVLRFIQKIDDRLPWFTAFDPFVFKIIVNLMVEAIVRLANRGRLWQPGSTDDRITGWPASGLLARLWSGLIGWFRDLAWKMVLSQYRVPRRLEQAIDAVTVPERMAAMGGTLRRVIRLLVWAAKNKQRITSFIDVVSAAIREAERLAELSGPAKQAYARALLIAFLEETGFLRGRSQAFMVVVNGFLDGAIDSVVQTLNRRKPGWAMSKRAGTAS